MIRQLQITVPAAGALVTVPVQGNYVYVISAPDTTAGSEALLYMDNRNNSGVPLLTRAAIENERSFQRLIIEGTTESAAGSLFLLVASGIEASAGLVLNRFGYPKGDPGDLFEYNTTPGNLLVRVMSATGLVRASTLNGGGVTLHTGQFHTATFHEAADPSFIYYPASNTIVQKITPAGSGATNMGHMLSSASENVGSNGRIQRLLFSPDGAHLFGLLRLSLSGGERVAVRRKDAPYTALWASTSCVTIFESATGQGNDCAGMSIDYGRRMLYFGYTELNGGNAIVRLAWDGSIQEVLYSYTNGVSLPQPLIGGIAYCPLDDKIYFTRKEGSALPFNLHLYSMDALDGANLTDIGVFGSNAANSDLAPPLEYHHGADFFLTTRGTNDTPDYEVIAIDRSGNEVGALGDYAATRIADLQFY